MSLDQWDWLDKPIDPCPRDVAVPPTRIKSCNFWERIWNKVKRKRDYDDK